MQYQTSRRFLEIFGLRNIRELPSLSEIDELLPEGIEPPAEAKATLDQVTDELSEQIGTAYSVAEDELEKVSSAIESIRTTSDFLEEEKLRQKESASEE